MKKRISSILAFLCLMSLFTAPFAQAANFSDVSSDAYYANAVTWAVGKGVTDGFSDGTFRPEDPCTRGQVVTFLWRASGKPEPKKTENPFSDVEVSSPFYKAILWACERGITNGKTATTFDPSGPCTRGQIVTFIWRANGEPSAPEGNAFTSEYNPTAYYTKAVAWADSLGLLGGTYTPFKTDDVCPRSDVVTYLYRNTSDGASNRSKAYTPDYDKWTEKDYSNGTSVFMVAEYYDDKHGFFIKNPVPGHAMWTQVVPVKPHMDYAFQVVYIVEDFEAGEEGSGGACIGIANPKFTLATNAGLVTSNEAWRGSTLVFNSGTASSVCLCLSNGWYGASSAGSAWFKRIFLEEKGTNTVQPMF